MLYSFGGQDCIRQLSKGSSSSCIYSSRDLGLESGMRHRFSITPTLPMQLVHAPACLGLGVRVCRVEGGSIKKGVPRPRNSIVLLFRDPLKWDPLIFGSLTHWSETSVTMWPMVSGVMSLHEAVKARARRTEDCSDPEKTSF